MDEGQGVPRQVAVVRQRPLQRVEHILPQAQQRLALQPARQAGRQMQGQSNTSHTARAGGCWGTAAPWPAVGVRPTPPHPSAQAVGPPPLQPCSPAAPHLLRQCVLNEQEGAAGLEHPCRLLQHPLHIWHGAQHLQPAVCRRQGAGQEWVVWQGRREAGGRKQGHALPGAACPAGQGREGEPELQQTCMAWRARRQARQARGQASCLAAHPPACRRRRPCRRRPAAAPLRCPAPRQIAPVASRCCAGSPPGRAA